MDNKNKNATRFIAAYNRLDQGLRDIYSIKRTLTFSDMIRKVASVNTVVSKFEEDLIDLDDDHFFEMVDMGESSINTFGYSDKADLRVASMDLYRDGNLVGINLKLDGLIKDKFKVSTPGKFSSYNAISAILTCHLMGIEVEYMKKALSDFSVKADIVYYDKIRDVIKKLS